MRSAIVAVVAALMMIAASPRTSRAAGIPPETGKKLYERVTPSLVAVQFTWEGELERHELSGAGIVVADDGTTICDLGVIDMRIPDVQLKEFKIIVPDPEGKDADEIDAVLLGRVEPYNLAFLRPKESNGHKWVPIKFEDASVNVGDPLMAVGMLPKLAAYKTYYVESGVSAQLRGETPQVLVQGGGLPAVGAPVFNADGKAIGIVNGQTGQLPWLNNPNPNLAMNSINNPPRFFVPARDFLPALEHPPEEGKPVQIPWMGAMDMTGLNKDVAEAYGLANQPAIQVGDVIPGAPADKAGLKTRDIIVKLDGKPLERGDEPDELPHILRRQVSRMKVGDTIKLSVLRKKGEPLKDIEIKLEEMPKRPNAAKRWYAEDLGFVTREMVFVDTYARHLKQDAKGVVVELVRRQSAAQSAGLKGADLITELNREPVTSLEEFQKSYEKFRKDKPKEAVVMVVIREGNTQTIRIEPPQ